MTLGTPRPAETGPPEGGRRAGRVPGGAGTSVEAYGPFRWPRGWGLGDGYPDLSSLQAHVLPSARHNQKPEPRGQLLCLHSGPGWEALSTPHGLQVHLSSGDRLLSVPRAIQLPTRHLACVSERTHLSCNQEPTPCQ